MARTIIIIPSYNEQNTLIELIESINRLNYSIDYLIVNDCSTDDTVNTLKKAGADYISAPVNLGIGGAVQLGYKYAYENDYDIAIQVDGDGQHDVSYVISMIECINKNEADIVIGSRFISCEGFQSSSTRRIGIKILSTLIYIVCRCKINDVTSGFRAINRNYIRIFSHDYPDDYPEPEVIVSASLNGAVIKEIPVIMRERTVGKSSISVKKSFYYMIKVSIAIIMCRISLGFRRD